MDNQTHNSDNEWIDNKMAILVPSSEWHPDSKRALAQFLKRRDHHETEASPRWIRLSMAAAILASIGLVVTLLPWHALWKHAPENKATTLELAKAATPVVVPEPAPLPPAPKPTVRSEPPAPAAAAASQETAPPPPDRSSLQAASVLAAVQQTAPPATEQEQKPVEHLGPGVTPPRAIPPMPEPNYTDEARQAHIQGTVIISVIIHADGTGEFERIVQSLDPGLDQKAIEAFAKWRFTPALKDGKPVDVQLQVTFNFKLY